MTLTGRFSAVFLGALAAVLAGFSLALFISARVYLERRVGERLDAALAVLAAAAEIHPDSVEWEPNERALPLGQELGPDRLRWMVFDPSGRRIDGSRNLRESELTAGWMPRPGGADLPGRLADREGNAWRVAQRRIGPESAAKTGSRAAREAGSPPESPPSERHHPALILTACAPLAPTEATLRALAAFLAAFSAGAWLAAALVCRRLSRRALAPLTLMVESARGLHAEDPGWSLALPGTGDELDALGRAFNDLLARLRVAYERQGRFAGDASHQLRTPLTVLIGQVEVALRHDRPAEEYRRVLKSALGRAQQLGQIVEALLFLARAEGDATLPRGETIDLGPWLAGHLASRPDPGRSVDVQLEERPGEPLPVVVHAALFGQMIDNLVENACKYTSPGTTVRVRARREGDAAIVSIRDAGPGIPPEDLPRVFEPFYRSAEARRLGVPGAGLGLAVARRIAKALGGEITAANSEGGGCSFEVRLPVARVEKADVSRRDAEGVAEDAERRKTRRGD